MSDARRRRKLIKCIRYEIRLHEHASKKLAMTRCLTRRLKGPHRIVWPMIVKFGRIGVL